VVLGRRADCRQAEREKMLKEEEEECLTSLLLRVSGLSAGMSVCVCVSAGMSVWVLCEDCRLRLVKTGKKIGCLTWYLCLLGTRETSVIASTIVSVTRVKR
jgi:hypothetical protein